MASSAPTQAAPLPSALLSYAAPEDPWVKKAMIRLLELSTGQPRLKRIYEAYQRAVVRGSFWEEALTRLEVGMVYNPEQLAAVPADGPLVMVANHPFGVLDGIIMGYLASQVREEFKILTNSVMCHAEEIQPHILPIDFAETRAALQTNLATRKRALATLENGGTIVVFPGGTVSTASSWFGAAEDPEWKTFTARLIMQQQATVLPVYFQGQNSRIFQIASQMSMTLRLGLLIGEVRNKIGSTIRFHIGRPLPYDELAAMRNRVVLMDWLRTHTYALARHVQA